MTTELDDDQLDPFLSDAEIDRLDAQLAARQAQEGPSLMQQMLEPGSWYMKLKCLNETGQV